MHKWVLKKGIWEKTTRKFYPFLSSLQVTLKIYTFWRVLRLLVICLQNRTFSISVAFHSTWQKDSFRETNRTYTPKYLFILRTWWYPTAGTHGLLPTGNKSGINDVLLFLGGGGLEINPDFWIQKWIWRFLNKSKSGSWIHNRSG